jgi:hypothetical protein
MKINTEEKKQRNEMIVYVSALLALFFLLLDGIWGFNVVRDAIAFVVHQL